MCALVGLQPGKTAHDLTSFASPLCRPCRPTSRRTRASYRTQPLTIARAAALGLLARVGRASCNSEPRQRHHCILACGAKSACCAVRSRPDAVKARLRQRGEDPSTQATTHKATMDGNVANRETRLEKTLSSMYTEYITTSNEHPDVGRSVTNAELLVHFNLKE